MRRSVCVRWPRRAIGLWAALAALPVTAAAPPVGVALGDEHAAKVGRAGGRRLLGNCDSTKTVTINAGDSTVDASDYTYQGATYWYSSTTGYYLHDLYGGGSLWFLGVSYSSNVGVEDPRYYADNNGNDPDDATSWTCYGSSGCNGNRDYAIVSCDDASTPNPTQTPTSNPTQTPTTPVPTTTSLPSAAPSMYPTPSPTQLPTLSDAPTVPPTVTSVPTKAPSDHPSSAPIPVPTALPTAEPTPLPTSVPTVVENYRAKSPGHEATQKDFNTGKVVPQRIPPQMHQAAFNIMKATAEL
uniref:Uncharacterized protein n=1 Tax=Florenciella parvula TaxID=236787 RepID=A0A7S2FS91_9STRA|mmetsp:Transcript_2278/g.5083  ORF Transcript_2278/g.5083 Transcript_2278/m.5083 type:complete len:298 (+) Transcript_2278:75-968(+)